MSLPRPKKNLGGGIRGLLWVLASGDGLGFRVTYGKWGLPMNSAAPEIEGTRASGLEDSRLRDSGLGFRVTAPMAA